LESAFERLRIRATFKTCPRRVFFGKKEKGAARCAVGGHAIAARKPFPREIGFGLFTKTTPGKELVKKNGAFHFNMS
jgi:hypothetical protein